MHIDTLPRPLPLLKTRDNLAEIYTELTAGGIMKHIDAITLPTLKSKYIEQDLSTV